MPLPAKNKTISSQYILITFIAVSASWVLHEFAHWVAGELLGYEMGITFNKTFPVSGIYNNDWHYQVISAAGPVFTLIEAMIVFIIMQRKKSLFFIPFCLPAFTCGCLPQ